MGVFQPALIEQSTQVKIVLRKDHELVKLTNLINWTELTTIAMTIRDGTKAMSGPVPRYRQLLGAVALMATKRMTYRDAEDLISHYAPARYLCDLMDSDVHLDHVTIFDFTKTLGDIGLARINESILSKAKNCGFLDPSVLMSDTTAQEAMIPYPTEVGLMSRFSYLAQKAVSKLTGKFQGIKDGVKEQVKKIKELVRNSHLFAKGKEQKGKVGRKIYHTVKSLQQELAALLATGRKLTSKGGEELTRLVGVMDELLPQILHFLKTGFVANKKIIHLQMDKLYAIVRGKAGKKVEFGLKWAISRIGGGFLQGFLLGDGRHASDQIFCMEAIKYHQRSFGVAPETYGFDRGGYSASNIKQAKKLGVKNVGIAPTGKTPWAVGETMRKKIVRERAQVEGGIGTIKSSRYGFNKPNAKSTAAMARCGQRAILGFNMRKLTREWTAMQEAAAMT